MVMNLIKKQNGFSILELVFALTIIGILTITISSGVGVSRDYDEYRENNSKLEKIKVGLLTFVQVNGYMPCPDTDTPPNGIENRVSSGGDLVCDDWEGQLPYQMLGVEQNDVWQSPYYYAVNQSADDSGTVEITNALRPASFFNNQLTTVNDPLGNPTWDIPVFNINTGLVPFSNSGNLTVCGESAGACANSAAITPDAEKIEIGSAIAVVVSYGKNGLQTWNGAALDAAETENSDGDPEFWQFSGSNNLAVQFFDDQLIWLTGNDIKAAMLQTERGLR